MNIFSAWRELTAQISAADSSKMKLFRVCSDWCIRYQELLGKSNYQLESLASLNCEEYIEPAEACTVDESAMVRALTLPLPKQRPQDAAARRLRDALETLLAVKSSIPCASCGSAPLYAEAYSGGIFWLCSVCGKSQSRGKIINWMGRSVSARLATPTEVRMESAEDFDKTRNKLNCDP